MDSAASVASVTIVAGGASVASMASVVSVVCVVCVASVASVARVLLTGCQRNAERADWFGSNVGWGWVGGCRLQKLNFSRQSYQ